jgi:hypothetical protein
MPNDTHTVTLTEFLLARIAEDEAAARLAWPERWEQDGERNAVQTAETGLKAGYDGLHMGVAHLAMTVGSYRSEARNAAHIARHDPARVLAECEVKRRIVELCAFCDDCGDHMNQDQVRALLALPYADHPDYRDEWKP